MGKEQATCAEEIFSPYFGGFGLNSLVELEAVLGTEDAEPTEIGETLAFFYRCFDRAGHQVQYDRAPSEIQHRVDDLNVKAVERLRAAGVDPAKYGYGVAPEVI